jgi:polyhydroxybutyrate depolymerase
VTRSIGTLAVLLLLLAGCQARPGPAAGSSTRTITVDGRVRTFHVYRPASLADPAPLVLVLHGGFGDGTQAESSYGWDAQADRGHFLVAYPDGVNRAWAVGGGCCGTPGRTGVDDVAFLVAVVRALRGLVPVDPSRVYATGISNGGLMAYRLACDTKVFAAIGPDSATQLGPCPAPTPISIIHIHGTADHNIPYQGGTGDGVAHIDGPAVPDLIAQWRAVDRCAPPAVTVAGPVTTALAGCPAGRAVELITIDGAGHQWPGSRSTAAQRALGLDPPSTALDATATIWSFFATHQNVCTIGAC